MFLSHMLLCSLTTSEGLWLWMVNVTNPDHSMDCFRPSHGVVVHVILPLLETVKLLRATGTILGNAHIRNQVSMDMASARYRLITLKYSSKTKISYLHHRVSSNCEV